jgi:hypothetical protein
MNKRKREKSPSKHTRLIERLRQVLDSGKYRDVVHAQERQTERQITRPEYTYVLRNGYHEARKDEFKEEHNAWNYSIRGRTVDKRDLRVVVSFDEEGMLIITTIEVGK